MSKTTTLILILILFVVGIYLIAADTVLIAARILVWVFVVATIGIVVIYLKIAYEKFLEQREKRHKIGREIITHEGQVFARETDYKATYRALHTNPHWYVNGKQTVPTQAELATYQAHLSRKRRQEPLMIEGQTIEQQRSVFDLLNESIHFALIGPTNSGKTTLANHFVDRIQADVTYTLDPHAKFNVWSTRCQVVDTYLAIEEQLYQFFDEMRQRYTMGPSNYQSILIAIDEWPSIVAECEKAEKYLKRLSSEGRKVNINLILLSQSDLIQDMGTNTSVRENFLKIILSQDGVLQNQAVIRHWDKRRESIILAGAYNQTTEQRVLAEWNRSGDIGAVVAKICTSDGGNQRKKITEILERNNLL